MMTIGTCIGRFAPDIDAHDMQCVHFARLFRGHKPIGRWMPNTSHRHAEHNALRAIRHPMQRPHARLAMVVVRFARNPPRMAMSQPCERCVDLLKARRVRTVVYSDHDGRLVVADVCTLAPTPSSMACHIPSSGRVVSYSSMKGGRAT